MVGGLTAWPTPRPVRWSMNSRALPAFPASLTLALRTSALCTVTLCTAALWTVALGTAVPAAQAPALAATPAASPAAPATRSAPEQAALTRGRALMAEFLAVNLGPLWPSLSPAVRAQWGTLEGFTAFRRTGIEQYGAELRVVRERTFMQGGEAVYVRSAIFEKAPQQVWAFVVGFTGPQVTTFGVLLEQDRSDDPVGRAAGYGPL